MSRIPKGVGTSAYRSPPIRASAAAALYRTAAWKCPTVEGTGLRKACCAASATERTAASTRSRRLRRALARVLAKVTADSADSTIASS